MRLIGVSTAAALALAAAVASAQQAAPQVRIDRQVGAAQELELQMGQNRLLSLSEDVNRVAVADPRIADLKVITPTQVLLTANGVGTTDLTLWNRRDEPLVISLQVSRNLDPLRRQLAELFPGEPIEVSSVGDLVVMSGEVKDVRVPERAAEVAKLHSEKLANLVRVAGHQQVQLEVKFAEVNRTGLRTLGFNFFHKDLGEQRVGGMTSPRNSPGDFLRVPGTGTSGVGGQPPEVYSPVFRGEAFSLFFSSAEDFPFSVLVNTMEANGLAKVLAEPLLVSLSGQEAKFLAGGEVPIPVATGLGTFSVQWKKFGIQLVFTPTVIGEEAIHLKVAAEVSELDPTASIQVAGVVIPGLASRQSETTVRLGDGQSFAIAGLLSDKTRSELQFLPLLGEIPIIGTLFRSTHYQRQETELLVVVTTRLVKPLAPHEVPPLPGADELNDPNDFELFLMGWDSTSRDDDDEDEDGDKRGGQQPAPGNEGAPTPPPAGGGSSAPAPEARPTRGPAGAIGFSR